MGTVNNLMGLMPFGLLNILGKYLGKKWRYAEVVDEVRLKKYMRLVFCEGKKEIVSDNCPCCNINTLEWDYPLFECA